MKLIELWEQLKSLVNQPVEETKERALSMNSIYEMAWRAAELKYPMAYLRDVFADQEGSLFAIISQDSKLYRSTVAIGEGDTVELGEWVFVTQEFVPAGVTRTQIIRENGKVRWLSISATATVNKSLEIDSRNLFDSFVRRAEETGQYPVRRFFHLDGDRWITGQTDFLARVGNCYITTGTYNDTPLAQAEIKAREKNPDAWGDSIGYIPMDDPTFIKVRGMDIPVYQDGINVEISTLPVSEAASLFVKTEVKRQMNEKQLKALAELNFDGDIERARKWLEENPEEVNRQIEQNGLITRTTEEEGGLESGVEGREVDLTEELVSEIVKRMADNEVVRALQATIEEQAQTIATLRTELDQVKVTQANLDVRIKPLEKGTAEIERQARLDAPANGVVKVGFRPSVERGTQQNEQVSGTEVAEATLDKIGLKY